MKTFVLGNIKTEMHPNGFVKGFILKRELTMQECRYIMKAFLGINIATRKDMYSAEDWSDYNQGLTKTVNNWLKGDSDDASIAKYAYDCADMQLGLMNLIPIICYLKKKNIID